MTTPTTPEERFGCVRLSCTLAARDCVNRRRKADSGNRVYASCSSKMGNRCTQGDRVAEAVAALVPVENLVSGSARWMGHFYATKPTGPSKPKHPRKFKGTNFDEHLRKVIREGDEMFESLGREGTLPSAMIKGEPGLKELRSALSEEGAAHRCAAEETPMPEVNERYDYEQATRLSKEASVRRAKEDAVAVIEAQKARLGDEVEAEKNRGRIDADGSISFDPPVSLNTGDSMHVTQTDEKAVVELGRADDTREEFIFIKVNAPELPMKRKRQSPVDNHIVNLNLSDAELAYLKEACGAQLTPREFVYNAAFGAAERLLKRPRPDRKVAKRGKKGLDVLAIAAKEAGLTRAQMKKKLLAEALERFKNKGTPTVQGNFDVDPAEID